MAILGKLIAAAAICVLPLGAGAQSTAPTDKSTTTRTVPAGQSPTGSNQKGAQDAGEAAKPGQSGSQSGAEPSGSTTGTDMGKSSKAGQSGSQSGPEPSGATTDKDMSKSKMKTKRTDKMDKSDQTAPGVTTTYPAKTKDGRPTGDSNVKSTPAN